MSLLPVGFGASGGGYKVQRSVRLRAAASAYFNRTLGTATNRRRSTLSMWVKRGSLGRNTFFGSYVSGSDRAFLEFDSSDRLNIDDFFGGGQSTLKTSTAVFRDTSAWYHIVLVYDTANATAEDRTIIYVNGSRITSWANNTICGQNIDPGVNGPRAHFVGALGSGTSYFDGYITEVNFIDGQALTPSAFAEQDPTTRMWVPKKYTGTYGTNGFYLDFSDVTSTTTLGYDKSGNGNNWTANNISLTSGTTYDSMLDVPTLWADGGNGRGNYAVLNPLDNSQGAGVIADGNLKVSYSASGRGLGTIFVDSGKWYAEFTAGQVSTATNADAAGVCGVGTTSAVLRGYAPNGQYYNGSAWAAYGATYTAGDVIGVAVDVASQTLEFFKNGTSQGQKTSIGLSTLAFVAWAQGASGNNIVVNFGQRPFAYTPPTGFKALHTGNLASDTVTASGSFTGNASADGPFVWCNGAPETLTINGNAVTWGTHADRLANGFKLRTSSSSYNASGTNTWTATVLTPMAWSSFRNQNAKGNP